MEKQSRIYNFLDKYIDLELLQNIGELEVKEEEHSKDCCIRYVRNTKETYISFNFIYNNKLEWYKSIVENESIIYEIIEEIKNLKDGKFTEIGYISKEGYESTDKYIGGGSFASYYIYNNRSIYDDYIEEETEKRYKIEKNIKINNAVEERKKLIEAWANYHNQK